MTTEEKELEKFRKWIRDEPIPIDINSPFVNDMIDSASGDYIESYCWEKKFSNKKTDEMFAWIALHNEVYVFLEEQGIRRKE
jgi:hypothetical protein